MGLSTRRILVPLLGAGLLLSAAFFAFTELVVPEANARANRVWRTDVEGREPRVTENRRDVAHVGRGGQIYNIGWWESKRALMRDVTIQEFAGIRLVRRLDAKRGHWNGEGWTFEDGILREFEPDGERVLPFGSLDFGELGDTPEDFNKVEREPDEMSYGQLREKIGDLRAAGQGVDELLTNLHLKVSFPLVLFFMVLIGAPLATVFRGGGRAISFAFTLGIAFSYYGLVRVGQAIGAAGGLPPWVAAWLGDGAAAVAGIGLLSRAEK